MLPCMEQILIVPRDKKEFATFTQLAIPLEMVKPSDILVHFVYFLNAA